eukprot:1270175-Rhodomonas_salina.4
MPLQGIAGCRGEGRGRGGGRGGRGRGGESYPGECICLGACYAMSGTDIAYGATRQPASEEARGREGGREREERRRREGIRRGDGR